MRKLTYLRLLQINCTMKSLKYNRSKVPNPFRINISILIKSFKTKQNI